MTHKSKGSTGYLNRRTFLGSLSAACSTLIVGCGNSEGDEPKGITTTGYSPDNEANREEQLLRGEIETLESVFHTLSEVPVTEGGKFVFDISHFEDKFDSESLIEQIEAAEDGLKSESSGELSTSRIDRIRTIAATARLLVQQRVHIHQVIAAGLACERRFYETEIAVATEAIADARQNLVILDSIGERINETMPDNSGQLSYIDWYDPVAIRRTQKMLVNIVLWTDPAYKGIYRMTRGMNQFLKGNSALEGERYEVARGAYKEAHVHFEQAQKAFENAQGRGTRLPYLVPFVEDIRCILPAYVSSTSQLSEAMYHFQVGQETQGRKIAQEAIESADQIAARCI